MEANKIIYGYRIWKKGSLELMILNLVTEISDHLTKFTDIYRAKVFHWPFHRSLTKGVNVDKLIIFIVPQFHDTHDNSTCSLDCCTNEMIGYSSIIIRIKRKMRAWQGRQRKNNPRCTMIWSPLAISRW
jgi:hypothetical protein